MKGILILAAEIRCARNRWKHGEPAARRFRVVLGLVAAFVFLLIFAGAYRAFHHLLFGLTIAPELGPPLVLRLIEMAHLLFFVMLFISALSVALSVFYLDPEIAFLRASPVPPSAFLLTRIALVLVRSSWFVLFTAAPLLLGYAFAAFLPIVAVLRFAYAFLILALYVVIPASLGTAAALLIARFIPARQAKTALVLLSVLGLSLTIIGLRAMTPERFLRPHIDPNLGLTLAAVAEPASPWLPSGWAALAAVEHSPAHSLAVLAAAFGGLTLAYGVARRFHADGLERFLVERDRGRRAAGIDLARFLTAPLPRDLALMARKDLKIFVRDPAQWSQLIILLALVVIYVFNFEQMRGEIGGLFLQNIISFVNLGMAGFVLVAVANRFVFSALSLEGRAFWLLRSSPFPLERVLRAKLFVAFLPLLALAETITILANRALGVSAAFATAAVLTVLLMTAVITALGVGLGALAPRFDLRDPAQIGMSPAGILFMGLGIAYVGALIALLASAVFLRSRAFLYGELPDATALAVPACLAILLSVLMALVPWRLGVARIKTMELKG